MAATGESQIVRNGAWLFLLQAFNTVLPLVTIPYVTRVLGADGFGVFSLALNWVTYLQVVVDYGFVLTGARKVALLDEGDHDGLQSLYNRIICSRIVLLVVGLLVLVGVFFACGMPKIHLECMLVLYVMVVGIAFQQTWLFQGKQDMKFITLANAAARIASVVLIFALIRGSDQVLLYCLLYSITYIGSSAIGMYIAKRRYNLGLSMASFSEVKDELIDGWYLFTSTAMTKIFSGLGVTVLGFVVTTDVVGAYSAIYKIPFAMTMLYSPLGQAIYPHVSRLFASDYGDAWRFIRKFSIPVIALFVALSVILICLRAPVVELLFGAEYVEYSYLVVPLTVWFMFGILNNILGVQILVASGRQKEYSRAFAVGVAAMVVLNLALGLLLADLGVALATMASEMILSVALVTAIIRT